MDLVDKWFNEATQLSFGESIFLPCNNKAEGKNLQKQFIKQKSLMLSVSPEKAYSVSVRLVLKNKQYYVLLEKGGVSLLTGFKKSEGKMSRVELSSQSSKERRRVLMERDGYSQEEIERIEADEELRAEANKTPKGYIPDSMGTS